MASRENQTMQILVMILFFVLVVLSALCYWMYRSYDGATKELANEREEKQATDNTNRQVLGENDELKKMLGFATEQGLEAINTAFGEDMKTYAEALAEESQDYRTTLQTLHRSLLGADQRAVEAKNDSQDLRDQLTTLEQATEQKIAEYQQQVDQLTKEYAGEKQKFDEQRQQMQADNANFEEKRKQLSDQIVSLKSKMDSQVAELSGKLANQKRLYAVLLEQTEGLRQDELLDRPDGKVSFVSARSNLVWLNIGSRQNLKPQTTFSVFAGGEHNIGAAQRKGAIEVINVDGPFSAEAKIIDFNYADPIVAGDLVYSNVWSPGHEDGFALAGMLDVDGDGLDDRDLVRNLISRNGGKIDAELDTNGERSGELRVATKYLVLGEGPTIGSGTVTAGATDYVSKYSAFKQEAVELGIHVVPLHRFVEMMGYQPEEQLVPVRGSDSGRDIHATLGRDAELGTEGFQPRQPRPPRQPPPRSGAAPAP